MSRKTNIIHQFMKELKKECKFSESKHEAKQKAREEAKQNHENYKQVKGIYSTSTYKDYCESLRIFTNYIVKNHSEVKDIEGCKKYIPEYIEHCREKGLSEWSIHKYSYALRSVFHCEIEDLNIVLGERRRADIVRCRDAEESPERNNEKHKSMITFIKATGCRRAEVLRLRKEDFRERVDSLGNKTGELEVFKQGKNGIKRWTIVNPNYADFVREFVANHSTINVAGEERLFRKADVPEKLPIHDLRSDYACDLYRYYEEQGYANGNLYHCRRELKGIHYDKGILCKVSYDLQHSRDNVVIDYLFKMR